MIKYNSVRSSYEVSLGLIRSASCASADKGASDRMARKQNDGRKFVLKLCLNKAVQTILLGDTTNKIIIKYKNIIDIHSFFLKNLWFIISLPSFCLSFVLSAVWWERSNHFICTTAHITHNHTMVYHYTSESFLRCARRGNFYVSHYETELYTHRGSFMFHLVLQFSES